MRLLEFTDDDDLSLSEFFENAIPKYAILSHRWELGEVTFKNLIDGTAKEMIGFKKIRFCGEQARRDGLQYFWVDTCCIDKSSSAELSEAINSMFRWYRESIKCYVYLSDVMKSAVNTNDLMWESAFRISKWFTRGWTLQELIAPESVEFFSKAGELLGNKSTLERQVCEITGIPAKALRGNPLSGFIIDERMSWAARRQTAREEDQAYCLLGIFDISIPAIYGEGRKKAFQRLREAVDKKVDGVPFVPDPKFASRGNVRQEKTHLLESQHRVMGFGNSGTIRGRSDIKCYRCDNRHRLKDCYATLDTVSKARDRRMISNRCVNCGSEEHWVKDCDWEDLRELNKR